MIEQQAYAHDLVVTGGNFPPTSTQVMIAQITQVLWFAGLALTFAGDTIFKTLGISEPPELYKQAMQNKMVVLGGLWFINNMGNSQLSTGAFELYLDDELIYSKIGNGRVPTGEVILEILAGHGFGK
jgi:thioredoxin reductase-like selenoprotein T